MKEQGFSRVRGVESYKQAERGLLSVIRTIFTDCVVKGWFLCSPGDWKIGALYFLMIF